MTIVGNYGANERTKESFHSGMDTTGAPGRKLQLRTSLSKVTISYHEFCMFRGNAAVVCIFAAYVMQPDHPTQIINGK